MAQQDIDPAGTLGDGEEHIVLRQLLDGGGPDVPGVDRDLSDAQHQHRHDGVAGQIPEGVYAGGPHPGAGQPAQIQGEQDDEHDGKPEGGNGDGHIVQAVGDAVEP